MPPDELTLDRALEAARAGRARRRAAGHLPRHAQAGVSEGRPLRAVRAARHAGRRREAEERLAAQGHEAGGRDLATALKLLSLPRDAGRPSADRQADRGLQRPLRAVRQVRRRDALAAGRRLAARRDARAGRRAAGPAQDARPRRRPPRRSRSRCSTNSPVTEQPVQLLDGRYGPYVTDGDTNASLPKGMTRRGAHASTKPLGDARREGGARARRRRRRRARRRQEGRRPRRPRRRSRAKKKAPQEEGARRRREVDAAAGAASASELIRRSRPLRRSHTPSRGCGSARC